MFLKRLVPGRNETIAALVSAALFAFAFPPFDLIFPIFLCLVTVAIQITRCADSNGHYWDAAKTGFWFGLLGYGCNLYWIALALAHFTKLAILGYIASLLWLTPVVGVTAVLLFNARRKTGWPLAILLPVVWTASELLLNYLGDLSFPWLPLGLAMSDHPTFLQAADISGVRGLSFWIAATNGLLADAWLLRQNRTQVAKRIAIVAGLAVAVGGYGYWRIDTIALSTLAKVSVIQPNIPEEDKLENQNPTVNVDIVAKATRAVPPGSDLIVWPETALPNFIWRYPDWNDTLRSVASHVRAPILFGVFDSNWPANEELKYWNAAMVTDSIGHITREAPYRKEYLVPIVERVPFINPEWFAGIKYFGGFGKGGDPVPFNLPFGKVGVLICYESVYPQLSRSYKKDGVKLLANITNDAWFGHSTAPHQHFAHLAVRAVENHLPIVRSANTGISAYIDPLGRVHEPTGLFVPATRTFNVETTETEALYTKFGDWIGLASAMIVLAFILSGLTRRFSRQ